MIEENYLKVKGKENLLRSLESNAIINCSEESYNDYIFEYKRAYEEAKKIKSLENEVSNIKSDLTDIKNILMTIVNKIES
jgi:hypothetical protein